MPDFFDMGASVAVMAVTRGPYLFQATLDKLMSDYCLYVICNVQELRSATPVSDQHVTRMSVVVLECHHRGIFTPHYRHLCWGCIV